MPDQTPPEPFLADLGVESPADSVAGVESPADSVAGVESPADSVAGVESPADSVAGAVPVCEEESDLPLQEAQPEEAPVAAAPPRDRRSYLLAFVLALCVFFPFLGSFGLWDPWETHYGEVTRNMIETHDWVSPRWGYEGRPVGAPPSEKGPFYSKPILIFWSEAVSIRLFGYSEWAFRFPMALLAFLCVVMAHHTVRSITGDSRAGLLVALVVATCPQFYMISRQAQTDMPFVGTMSLGMFFFLLAVFRPRTSIDDRVFLRQLVLTVLALLLLIFPQLFVVAADVHLPLPRNPLPLVERVGLKMWRNGEWHAVFFTLLALPVLLSIVLPIATQWRKHGRLSEAFKDLWSRRLHLAMFYACIALASLAKGLLGFLLPGAILFLFLLVTWNWRLISRLQLLRGVGVFICVGFPWYVAMFAVHGMAFYSRFFVHDHFNRFASGVHQVDTGLFEHFIKWLGLGMFPWAALVPVVLIPLMRLRRIPKTRRARLIVLLFVWTFFSYFLFTRSSTKFHHYIFPALIPLGVLIGLWLRDLPRLPSRWVRLAAVCGIGLVVSMGWTVHDDKQAIRNLMTYKYDRPLAKSLPVDPGAAVSDVSKTTWEDSRFFKETPAPIEAALTNAWGYYPNVIRAVGGLVLLGFLLWLISTSPAVLRAGTYMLGTGAMILAVWSLSVYMPMLSPAWSQKYIFDEYYARCSLLPNTPDIEDAYTPLVRRAGLGFIADMTGARPKQVCDEDIMAWLFTWRGETFYSNNEILPVAKAEHMKDYLKEFNNGKPFFAVLEIHRRSSFESSLNRESKALRDAKEEPFAGIEKWDVELAHAENPYFVLVHARPVAKTAKQPATATAPGATP